MILENVLWVVLLNLMANALDCLLSCPLLCSDLPIEQIFVDSATSSENKCCGWWEERSGQIVKKFDALPHKLSQVPAKGGTGCVDNLHRSVVSRATKVSELHGVGDGLHRWSAVRFVQVFCKAENGVQRRGWEQVRADVLFRFKSSFCVGSEVCKELPGVCFVCEMLACVHGPHPGG